MSLGCCHRYQVVPCARFVNILKNTPGACGFKRPEGYAQVTKAEIIKRLATLNIPVYEVDPKVHAHIAVFCCMRMSLGLQQPAPLAAPCVYHRVCSAVALGMAKLPVLRMVCGVLSC